MKKPFSILQENKECFICGTTLNLDLHHIFGGCNRDKSTKYGLVVYLCKEHHTGGNNAVHNNMKVMKQLRQIGQQAFEDYYKELSFIEIFRRNYL